MSEPITLTTGLSFWSDEPSKYDHIEYPTNELDLEQVHLLERLKHPDLKIAAMNDATATMLKGILPLIVAEWSPATLEFVDYANWLYAPNERRRLRGVIIRNDEGSVLLYAYGIGLTDAFSEEHRALIFDAFGIPNGDRQRIKNTVWSKLDYAVVIALPQKEDEH